MRCQVAIIGAGPAGLTLATMLAKQGIDAVVLEARPQEYVRARVRAGVIENTTVDILTELGVAARLHQEALVHNGFNLRFDRTTHRLDFHQFSGRHAYVYGQAEIVADLIDARIAAGLPLIFDAEVTGISEISSAATEITYVHNGQTTTLQADFVAGCDGFHGISRTLLPESVRTFERVYPFAWLGILARTTPVTEEGMYCAHPDGLSVHSMRGANITWQYLQVPADTEVADWPDERIWAELRHRSASDDHPELETGEIFDRSLAPLRSVVTERMQHGPMFLLGDAAHIVPPTGAKGLNLAVSDACVLSNALGRYYASGDRAGLDSYTDTALPRIWQAQNFSWTLTSVLHRFTDDPFDWELRLARLQRWAESSNEQAALGEVYLGLPFPTPWHP